MSESLEQRIHRLEELLTHHVGLDWGAAGLNYPHPNQSVSTAEYGGGIMRADATGLQIKSNELLAPERAAIWFLDEFVVGDPGDAGVSYGSISGERIPSTGVTAVQLDAVHDDDTYAQLRVDAVSTGEATGYLAAFHTDTATEASVLAVSSSGSSNPRRVEIVGTLVPWSRTTAQEGNFTAPAGAIWYNSTLGTLRVQGAGFTPHSFGGTIAQYGAASTVANTTTETAIASTSITGGLLGTSRGLRLRLGGTYLNNSGSIRTLRIRVKLGSTTLWDATASALGASATARAWVMDAHLMNLGSASSQGLSGTFGLSSNTAATAGTGAIESADTDTHSPGSPTPVGGVRAIFAGSATEDTSSARTLSVTVQHGAADANLSITRTGGSLELI